MNRSIIGKKYTIEKFTSSVVLCLPHAILTQLQDKKIIANQHITDVSKDMMDTNNMNNHHKSPIIITFFEV